MLSAPHRKTVLRNMLICHGPEHPKNNLLLQLRIHCSSRTVRMCKMEESYSSFLSVDGSLAHAFLESVYAFVYFGDYIYVNTTAFTT